MIKSVFAALVLVAASAAHADVYKLDTKASIVGWSASHKVGATHTGKIAVKDGEVQTDAKGVISGGTVNIDMTTISDEDLKSSPDYQKKLVGHLSSDDFFKVSKFPTSTFKVTSVTAKSANEVVIKGDLTIIGTTKPVEFPAKVTTDKGVMTSEATLKLDRTQWGLKYGSGNFFKELTQDKIINDDFTLSLKLVAKK